jgi:hypothetical protein
MPFKKQKWSNKKIGEPEHQKTMAFAYQVSWDFQTSPKCRIFASPGDCTVMVTPDSPPIHHPFFKSQYLDALGKAISAATTTCSESIHNHQYSFGSLSLKQRSGLANESLLPVTPVIPLRGRLDTGGLVHHHFLQRERLIHPELNTSSPNIVKLQSRYHGEPYFTYSAWWLQCINHQSLPKQVNGVAIAVVLNHLGTRAVELGAIVGHTSYHMIYVLYQNKIPPTVMLTRLMPRFNRVGPIWSINVYPRR